MLIDQDNCWIWRFWRDESAWVRDPKVFWTGDDYFLERNRY